MFKLKETISNVKRFAINSNNICLYNDKRNIYRLDTKEVIYEHDIDLQEIFFNNKFFINDLYGKGIFIDDNYTANFNEGFIHGFNRNSIIFSKREDETRDTYIYSFDKIYINKIKFSSLNNLITDNYYFRKSVENYSVETYTLPAAQALWQFDMGNFGEYKPIYGRENERKPYQAAKFLGVRQEELLLACDGGLIITLSLQNGQLIRKWDVLPEQIENNLKDTFHGLIHQSGNVFQLNKAGDTIFGLYYRHWVEISLKTGLISAKYLKETFDKHLISSFQTKSGYAEDETHLYSTVFLDQQKLGLNYMPTAVCALNKLTCEIDWLHRFDLDSTGDYVSVQVPQVANDKLYQLTQNHILHIFQKE